MQESAAPICSIYMCHCNCSTLSQGRVALGWQRALGVSLGLQGVASGGGGAGWGTRVTKCVVRWQAALIF